MPFSSFAECRTFQFCYQNRNALYIDHRGQRVLADVEGCGAFSIDVLPDRTTVWIDGTIASLETFQFAESLIITSESPGLSKISVRCGSVPTLLGQPFEVEKFDGCGWIVSSERIDSVDGMTDGWSEMDQLQPVPVMLQASGKGLRVVPAEGRIRKLFELDLSLKEDVKDHGWEVKNASKLFDLKSDLPGFGMIDRPVLSHLNQGSFEIAKPEGCVGILVRKLYDAFHGRQRARLLVDGKFRSWWYEPVEDRRRRWRWGQIGFEVPAEEAVVRVGIDPPAGAPLWSVSLIEVLGLWTNS